jgi:RNA polymerase sigma-70 factor (ECF subfamily)
VNAQELNIIRLVVKGDRKSFNELFEMYYPRIYVLAMSRLRNASEADDVSQQTMISVWQNVKTLKNLEAFPAWITRVAINNCNAVLRRDKRSVSGDSEAVLAEIVETDEELLPEPYVLREDLKKRLGNTVRELREEQREAVTLYYYNQLSVSEISAATGVSQNTVKSRLSLARKYIKGKLQAEESRTGVCYYGVAGVALTALGPALHEQFALWEPTAESISLARDEVMVKINARTPHQNQAVALPQEAGAVYLDELVGELRALSLVVLPLAPAGGLWPKVDSVSEGEPVALDDYLQQLRAYRNKVEMVENRFLAATEAMIAHIP